MKFKIGDKIIATTDYFNAYNIKRGQIFTVKSINNSFVGFEYFGDKSSFYDRKYATGELPNWHIKWFELAQVEMFNDKLKAIVEESGSE